MKNIKSELIEVRNKTQGSKNGVTRWNILVTRSNLINKYRYVIKYILKRKRKLQNKMKSKISHNVELKIIEKKYKKQETCI